MSSNSIISNNGLTGNIFTNTMADMPWTDIKSHADENAIVLLPIGVIEEHGPQLCLATDIYTSHIYCTLTKKMLEEKGYSAIVAPPFYWGVCQSSKGFIGSFNIRPETAKALLFDILTSLREFGFKRIFGVNTHGDVEHKIIAMEAFKDACTKLDITACFPYEGFMLPHFGLNGSEPYFYTIEQQQIKVSEAAANDVHGGDIETATINTYYPHLVNTEKAKMLPDVPLPNGKFEAWMFGGQLKQLSPQGYLGSPSSYDSVDTVTNAEDNADRITKAILVRINQN